MDEDDTPASVFEAAQGIRQVAPLSWCEDGGYADQKRAIPVLPGTTRVEKSETKQIKVLNAIGIFSIVQTGFPTSVREFLLKGGFSPVKNGDREFLRSCGTFLDDGRRAERVLNSIGQIRNGQA